jgi:tetratricopeptide (TPR) repeat protein
LEILTDGNMAVARSIAAGNYKRKSEVVPKWIAKSESWGKQLRGGEVDHALDLAAAVKSLSAYAAMEEPVDPTDAVERALHAARELISATTDEFRKREIEWTLACGLADAVQVEHMRGEFDNALKHANNAIVLLTENATHRESTHARNQQLGRMFFAMGAIYAVGNQDHAEAVHYYLKAQPLLSPPLAPQFKPESGRQGERLVSMGVSYWQNGNKEQAVDVTLTGMQLIRSAAELGHVDPQSLAVPYGNLASMYRQLGKTADAAKYAELAKRLETENATKKR